MTVLPANVLAADPSTMLDSTAQIKIRAEVAATLEAELAGFFPRSIDERGGFRCAFDESWQPGPDEPRLGVFQARMTWTAATVARRRPSTLGAWLDHARHGVAFLADHLWDARRGGFFWELDADTFAPTTPFKHAYGNAFCIFAAAAAFGATRDASARRLAIDGFAWLDEHAHDAVDGGYVEQLAMNGAPTATGDAWDLIGTPLGLRSMNTHIHLLEAFTELYRVWPDATLRERLVELVEIVRDRLPANGSLPPHFARGWRAKSDVVSYGHDVETAFLLLEATDALGQADDPSTLRVARAIWEHAFAHGEDAVHGGLFHEGRVGRPAYDRTKIWWVQAEALQSLLALHACVGEVDARFADAFVRAWHFARAYQLDAVNGGWFAEVSADGMTQLDARKGHAWKGCYHTVRAMLNVESLLGGSYFI